MTFWTNFAYCRHHVMHIFKQHLHLLADVPLLAKSGPLSPACHVVLLEVLMINIKHD